MSNNYKDDIREAYDKYAKEREKNEFQQWKSLFPIYDIKKKVEKFL